MADERDRTRIPRVALRVSALAALAFSAATATEYLLPGGTYCEPDGGCSNVRAWAFAYTLGESGEYSLGMLLPMLGVLGFTALFAGSLVRERRTMRITAVLAILGALIAIALLYLQATQIGAWCELCVGVDSFAILAGLAGVALLVTLPKTDEGSDASLRSVWWAGWVLAALAPIAWPFTLPDPAIPEAISELYVDGAINVVEIADFECPYCKAMHPVLKSAIEDAPGEVNLVRVIVPLHFHPHARNAASAYHCAVRVDRGEAMADALFAAHDLSLGNIARIARDLGLDMTAFELCRADPAIQMRIAEDERIARESQNQGLPTVYIGERVLFGYDASAGAAPFREALEAAKQGDGARVRVWPLATVALLAALAAVLGRKKR